MFLQWTRNDPLPFLCTAESEVDIPPSSSTSPLISQNSFFSESRTLMTSLRGIIQYFSGGQVKVGVWKHKSRRMFPFLLVSNTRYDL